MTVRQIASKYHMCVDSISRRAINMGLEPRGPHTKRPHITPEQCGLFEAAWQLGCGVDDLAAHFDVTRRTVGNTVTRLGLTKRVPGTRPKTTVAAILAKMAQMRANDAMRATAKADHAAWKNAEMLDGRNYLGRAA